MKKFSAVCLVVTMILVAGGKAQANANMIINGDFENNTAAGTMYNMSNAEFSSVVANATAFGTSEELDLVATGSGWGIDPESGSWKVGLHQRTDNLTHVDAFSFDLSSPVISGNTYDLQFFAAGIYGYPLGQVEIGLSSMQRILAH